MPILALGCGNTERSTEPPDVLPTSPTPAIRAFEAAPDRVGPGASVTLSWRTENVVSLALTDDQGTELPLGDADPANGSIEVQPTRTTTYTLTGTGAAGAASPVWRTAVVEVDPAVEPVPVIEAFDASTDVVAIGGEVTLSWRTTHATRLTLKDDAGAEIELGEAGIDEGQAVVRPTRPTTYALVATGPGGRAEALRPVDVSGQPRVTHFYVDPLAPVAAGETVTLHWETANVDSVVIRRDGADFVDTAETSGSRSLELDETSTFTLQATGPGGTAQATALARVGPRIVSFSASERVVRAADPVVLSWQLQDADRAVIDGPAGYHVALSGAELASGSATVDVTVRGDFVLQAFRADVGVTGAVSVAVTDAPRVRSLSVDQAVVTAAADHPAVVSLSWVQDGADRCTIFRNNVEVPGYTGFACGLTGHAELQVFGDATLKLVAVNTAGDHSAVLDVQAVAPARIAVFASNPARRLTPGSTVELSWSVTGAASVSMTKNDAPFAIAGTAFTGTATDRVDFDSSYVLTAVNSLGYPTVAGLDVRAGAPTILTAVAEPDFVGIGDAVTLSWTIDGGETLTVTGPDGTELFRTTESSRIDAGSTVVLVPLASGTYDYTITVVNGAGATDSAVVSVVASDGPMIRSFTANKTTISLGEAVTLSWAVDDDVAGNTPTLALVDDQGGVHDVSATSPNVGSIAVTPTAEGPHVFTLTATTTPGRTPGVETVAVDVTVAPIAVSFTATPDTVSTENGTVVPDVVLAWESKNAVAISLWESDAAGNVIPPAFHRRSLAAGDAQSLLDAGSVHIAPTATTWYVVRVQNRVGSFVDLKVKVVVDPPKALTFVADPAEIVAGETVQLTWTTENALSAAIDPLPVARLGNTYIDISPSGTGTGTQATLTGDTSRETLTFANGFVFPFGGANRTQIQVSTNGWAGFNTANTANSASPGQLPADGVRYINFALYVADLDSDEGVTPGFLFHGPASDAKGGMYVIQWKNWSWWSSSYDVSDLNFELILRPNGDFEYRYANMQANGSTTSDRANGVGATIGFQYPTNGSYGMTVVPDGTRLTSLLSNSGFAFPASVPANGTLTTSPSTTLTYTLTASNSDASASRATSVTVWKVPAIATALALPAAPQATQPFRIAWTASDVSQIRVLDENGVPVCVVTDPVQLAAGSCTHATPTPGAKVYTVEATNGLARNLVTKQVNLSVFPLLSLDSFTVTPGNFVHSGDTVTVTWAARGASEVLLQACKPHTDRTACTDITPAGANPNGGSYTQTMTASLEFYVQIFDVQYRKREATQAVWVDAPSLDGLTTAATQIPAGASATLSWTSTGATSAKLVGMAPPTPVEVTATAPYLDISTTGTPVNIFTGTLDYGYYEIPFPAGFAFPWFGTPRTGVRVSTDGFLTFDMTYSTEHSTEQTLPSSSSTYTAVQIAPFWDDLEQTTDPLRYELRQTAEGEKYLVIAWHNWSLWTAAQKPSVLDFEALLYESGNVEFRYGAMTANPATEAMARGDSAAMGWQSPDRKVGGMLTAAAGDPVSGGLANRSWRFAFSLPVDGSTVLTPTDSATYRICVTNASLYVDCDEVRIVVVQPGDVLFTELMVAPASDDGEWFEVRNTALDPIDLAGWTVTSGAGESFTVPATPPLVVQPGEFVTFARSATANGGLAPDVVYGSALTLADATDEVRLSFAGTNIDGVLWNGTGWTIPANKSIALEPSAMARSAAANDLPASWCATAASYGDGTRTGSPGALGVGCLTGGGNTYYLVDPVSAMPFYDIVATGTDDSTFVHNSPYYTGGIPLGFTMPFFGDTVDTMYLNRNGFLAFEALTSEYTSNADLPNSANPDGLVAAFWDDGYFTTGVSKMHHQLLSVDGHLVMVVQWTDVSYGATSYGTITFQAQLWDNGDIVMVYRDLVRDNLSYNYMIGSSATFGLENLAGSQAVKIAYGTTSNGTGPIYDGRSYRLIRR